VTMAWMGGVDVSRWDPDLLYCMICRLQADGGRQLHDAAGVDSEIPEFAFDGLPVVAVGHATSEYTQIAHAICHARWLPHRPLDRDRRIDERDMAGCQGRFPQLVGNSGLKNSVPALTPSAVVRNLYTYFGEPR
jgi:hypothetical protein